MLYCRLINEWTMKIVTSAQVIYYFTSASLSDYCHNSSVPEGKLMGVELIGVYKSGLINWGL